LAVATNKPTGCLSPRPPLRLISGKLIINNAGFRDKATYKLLHHSSTNKILLVYGLYHQSEVRFKYIFRMLQPNKGNRPI